MSPPQNFLNGLGATQEVAQDIFAGIKNNTALDPTSGDDTADIGASIAIMGIMANASQIIVLKEDVFPVSSLWHVHSLNLKRECLFLNCSESSQLLFYSTNIRHKDNLTTKKQVIQKKYMYSVNTKLHNTQY